MWVSSSSSDIFALLLDLYPFHADFSSGKPELQSEHKGPPRSHPFWTSVWGSWEGIAAGSLFCTGGKPWVKLYDL